MAIRNAPFLLLIPAAALLAAGCGPKTLYNWRGYDDSLYAHYKSPQDHAKHIERMQRIVTETEAAGLKMPPGVYAEYGYALLEESRFDESVTYFNKEKETWPESAVLMEKMVRNVARLKGAGKAAGGSPGAAPAAGGSSR
ncbi:MAG: DUF4810 domain-containing protein [Gemmatimonadota bacterium]